MWIHVFILLTLWAPAHSTEAEKLFSKWTAIKNVYPGPTQPIGSYDAGCLAGAEKIEPDGMGYAVMRLARRKFYMHDNMKSYLQTLGAQLKKIKSPLLLVGDASGPRGGPSPTGHASHQTGLDVDLWLRMSARKPTRRQRESWSAPSFVSQRKKLRKNWSKTQVNLIKTAATIDSVNRIFVSPPIKKYFCEKFPESEWLYKLRPWWGHEEHIHVRLNCPTDNSTCTAQAPLNSKDNGCGTDLAWWFSQEADEQWAKLAADHTPRAFPELPKACEKMIN